MLTWLFFPGTVVYLAVLELIPTCWEARRRRLAAVLLSPLSGALLWFDVVEFDEIWTHVVMLLGPMLYGSVVRLRPAAS